MESPEKKRSSFGSFLEGFKQEKIGSVGAEVEAKLLNIQSLVGSLKEYFTKEQNNEGAEICSAVAQKIGLQGDILEKLYISGEMLQTLFSYMQSTQQFENKKLLSKAKRIFGIFAESAKLIGDKHAMRMALELGTHLS